MKPYKIIDFIANKVPEYSYENMNKISEILMPVDGKGYVDDNGLRQGLFKSKDRIGGFKNNLKHGYWESYHPNGKLRAKGNYENNKMVGEWVAYYSNGKPDFRGSYENGDPHGYWEEYYSNGKLYLQGYYKNGNQVGTWYHYSRKGERYVEEYPD
jgi:antitoxin component YwqK of YwqJK toxin-antitoxin module